MIQTNNNTQASSTPGYKNIPVIFLIIFLPIFLFLGYVKFIKKNSDTNKNNSGNAVITEPPQKQWFEDSVFVLNLTQNDSVRVKVHNGFTLESSSGGTEDNPIPYQSRNAKEKNWDTFGIGGYVSTEPDSHVWFKGYDSTRVKISYWYEKIK